MTDAEHAMTDAGVAAETLAQPLEPAVPAAPADPPAPPTTPTSSATPAASAADATASATAAAAAAAEAVTAATPTSATDAPAEGPKPRRRLVMPTTLAWVLRMVIGTALFVGGIALGVAVFQGNQQPPAQLDADPATVGIATPAVVREFVIALESNDADALRSAVAGDPYRLLAGEMQKWGFQEVTSVETLATTLNGARSATEIVMRGRDTAAAPIIINLIVHTEGTAITDFR
jgi:hypothetical protein